MASSTRSPTGSHVDGSHDAKNPAHTMMSAPSMASDAPASERGTPSRADSSTRDAMRATFPGMNRLACDTHQTRTAVARGSACPYDATMCRQASGSSTPPANVNGTAAMSQPGVSCRCTCRSACQLWAAAAINRATMTAANTTLAAANRRPRVASSTATVWPYAGCMADSPRVTDSGIEIKPLYGPDDLEGWDYDAKLGDPGKPPYTRGVYPTMYRGRPWTIRPYSGFGTAEATNQRFKYLLANGSTGLSCAFDLPTQIGYDSDSPRAEGEVGKVGVAIDS